MHELSIAMGIVEHALEAAEKHGAETVEEVTVELGSATHVNPEQLRFCIETATSETAAADSVVTIEQITPLAHCDCGWEGEPGVHDAAIAYAPDVRCPECGDRSELVRGRECRLAAVELPDETSQQHSSQTDEPPSVAHANSAPDTQQQTDQYKQ